MLVVLVAMLCRQVMGHGAVANPSGRRFQMGGGFNCQWCMGEMKHDGSNPPGQIRKEAKLSSPCMGTQRGGNTRPNWGPYSHIAGNFDRPTYTAGQSFEASIAMDANHQGDAQWQFCPHSEAETDECFRRTIVKDWEGVNCHFNDCGAPAHRYSKSTYKETVTLPNSLPSGPGTLRWYWVCLETNEIFASCIDVDIVGGAPPTPAPAPGASGCAADSDDCSSSQCCADESKTCYTKDEYWASCRADCTPGINPADPPQYQTPWTCSVLGVKGKPAPTTPASTPAPVVPVGSTPPPPPPQSTRSPETQPPAAQTPAPDLVSLLSGASPMTTLSLQTLAVLTATAVAVAA